MELNGTTLQFSEMKRDSARSFKDWEKLNFLSLGNGQFAMGDFLPPSGKAEAGTSGGANHQ